MSATGPRILLLDIETSPCLARVWGLWDQNVGLNQLEAVTEVICWAAKWLGERRVLFSSQQRDGHAEMVSRVHALLDEADCVVTYNGDRFDLPHLNREFLQAGLAPPSPYHKVDLFKAVKLRFNFPSNKLEYVLTALHLQGKVKHSGFDLWRGCLLGDEKSWRQMERYNKRDVTALEELYGLLLPWIPGLPNRQMFGAPEDGCPSCGSGRLQSRGLYRSQTRTYRRYQCQSCGAWHKSTLSVGGVKTQPAAL